MMPSIMDHAGIILFFSAVCGVVAWIKYHIDEDKEDVDTWSENGEWK